MPRRSCSHLKEQAPHGGLKRVRCPGCATVPRRHRTVGRHASPIFRSRSGYGRLRSLIGPLHGATDAEIADRQDVRTLQPEDEEHLCRPPANPLHLDQRLDDLLVAHQSSASRSSAGGYLGAEVAQIRCSSAGSSRPREAPRRQSPPTPSRVGTPSGISATIAGVNRRRRFRGQLLTRDGADERGEMVGALSGGKAARALPPDQRGKNGITAKQDASRAWYSRWVTTRDHSPGPDPVGPTLSPGRRPTRAPTRSRPASCRGSFCSRRRR